MATKRPDPLSKGSGQSRGNRRRLTFGRVWILPIRVTLPDSSISAVDEHFSSLIDRLLPCNLDCFALSFYHSTRFLTSGGLYSPSVRMFYDMLVCV